ncbi:hypothetical protein Bbelb_106170 [Branchiostoma belcheri]|nr:hypothetical protein Bbelb_106170 [Branchiostoma belcheri]
MPSPLASQCKPPEAQLYIQTKHHISKSHNNTVAPTVSARLGDHPCALLDGTAHSQLGDTDILSMPLPLSLPLSHTDYVVNLPKSPAQTGQSFSLWAYGQCDNIGCESRGTQFPQWVYKLLLRFFISKK